ncbi:chemokine (C-X-C motif) ligand 20 isoform X2 [Stegastes partitus]|uniref:Chemokine (C-X-C motif) ligand 20 isoform X2 n=1 Tax=Stegastes partitus TaxID=144197 RepID=A0A9Y4JZK2_9TELE|nr:PREDICTED: C-X-C motif chemokine 10-like isoform X2 [Stegastes partitus]
MNSAVITFFISLLVLCAQGQQASGSSKCKCINSYISRGSRQLIGAQVVVFPPSIFCPRTEIIISTAANKEKCVNPQSPLGQHILKNKSTGRRKL